MTDFSFCDALTGSNIEFDYSTGDITIEKGDSPLSECTSIFFPGCSFLNYAMPLVSSVYDTLRQHGVVEGISILCCGKILSYEENGRVVRDAYEEQLREHVSIAKIEQIVCACPNCVKALREAFIDDGRTKDVKIVVLPQMLADLGYRVDVQTAAALLKGERASSALLCTHDSCPDREYGEFAKGLRAVLPDGAWVDPKHTKKTSICCGSLPRAQGKDEQADKCAAINGSEAQDVGADAIVTACMSCSFQLNMAQKTIPAIHFLELLYNWRIDWEHVGCWMKFRFLFDEALGAIEKPSERRTFVGMGENAQLKQTDYLADSAVAISNDDTLEIGE